MPNHGEPKRGAANRESVRIDQPIAVFANIKVNDEGFLVGTKYFISRKLLKNGRTVRLNEDGKTFRFEPNRDG